MADEPYSRITRRMWRDAKYRKLSRPAPSARELWWYLLSSPRSVAVPGLLPVGVLSIAEDLEWSPDDARTYLLELEQADMIVVDPDARLIWLPNSIHHNRPANPSVVVGWGPGWRSLPECALLDRAGQALRQDLAALDAEAMDDGRPAGLVAAFDVATGKRTLKNSGLRVGRPKTRGAPPAEPDAEDHQEQDPEHTHEHRVKQQDQEQEQDRSSAPTERAPASQPEPPPTSEPTQRAFALTTPTEPAARRKRPSSPTAKQESHRAIAWRTWRAAYEAKYRRKYSQTSADGPAMDRIVKAALAFLSEVGRQDTDLEALLTYRWTAYLRDSGDKNWLADNGHPVMNAERGVPRYGSPWDKPAKPQSTSLPGRARDSPAEPAPVVPALKALATAAGNGGTGAIVMRPRRETIEGSGT